MSDAIFQKLHGLFGLSMPMGFIVLGWIAGFIATIGLGSIFWQFSGKEKTREWSPFARLFCSHWIGMTAATAAIVIWNLFSPVSGGFAVGLFFVGFAGILLDRAGLYDAYKHLKRHPGFVLCLIGICVWFANHSTRGFSEAGDAGLYHIPAARWAEAYRTLPGLGHVHGRLAFNNTNFLQIAALDHGPWDTAGQNVLTGLYYLPLAAASLWALYVYGIGAFSGFGNTRLGRIFHSKSLNQERKGTVRKQQLQKRISGFFLIVSAPYLVRSMHENAAETTGDVPALCVGLVCWLLVLLLVEKHAPGQDNQTPVLFTTLIATVALGITIKLSFVVFGGALLLVSLYAISRCVSVKKLFGSKYVWLSLLLSILLGGAWLGRFIIMTGFLVYPEPAIRFDVDWKLPTAKVVDEANWVKSWARDPNRPWQEVLADHTWLRPWFKRMCKRRLYKEWIPLGMGFVSLAALLLWGLTGRATGRVNTRIHPLILGIPPACAAAFWFHLAPDPRFAGALWLIIGATPLAILALKVPSKQQNILFVMVLLLSAWPLATRWRTRPGDGRFGFYKCPVPAMKIFQTRSGLNIAVPKHGKKCWGIVPSMPVPNPSLMLRDGKTIQSGFSLDTENERP